MIDDRCRWAQKAECKSGQYPPLFEDFEDNIFKKEDIVHLLQCVFLPGRHWPSDSDICPMVRRQLQAPTADWCIMNLLKPSVTQSRVVPTNCRSGRIAIASLHLPPRLISFIARSFFCQPTTSLVRPTAKVPSQSAWFVAGRWDNLSLKSAFSSLHF